MKRRLCSAILSLQAVVLGLSSIALVQHLDNNTEALVMGLGLAVACILAAGMLRSSAGYYLGHAIQVASIALGVVTPVMIVLGVVFAALWVTAYRLGATIDRDKAAAEAAEA